MQWLDAPISTVTKALEDNLQFRPVFPRCAERFAADEMRELWQRSILEVALLNVRKDGWGTWKLYKYGRTRVRYSLQAR
jgi:hypothetical protein